MKYLPDKMEDVSYVAVPGPPLKVSSPLTIIMARENCGVSYVSAVTNSKSAEERAKMYQRLNDLLNT